jgi:hypothetical protein
MSRFLSRLHSILVTAAIVAGASIVTTGAVATTALASSGGPSFGSNVLIFNPSMTQASIQAAVDAVAAQQLHNEFGTQRYALLFEPGTYGSAASPLNFQVGYYTSVAGLGLSPNDVVINGSIDVYNQCISSGCFALVNFWRSLSNLTINVNHSYCTPSEFWAVSQAAPMRRVHINGWITLMDYCTGPSYASGGFIADSLFDGSPVPGVINGSQQQWLVRNSNLAGGWTNGVWNQVFSGVVGAPATCFPCTNPYTTLGTSSVTREAPYLYVDARGSYNVFVPSAQHNTAGTSWASGQTPGKSIPIDEFFVARPADSAATINSALRRGKNLLLLPGVYRLDRTIAITRSDTTVLGLGFPTLIPQDGHIAMKVSSSRGVLLSGLLFDAGPENSPVLLQVGNRSSEESDNRAASTQDEKAATDPSVLSDVFFRIGGAAAGKATTALVVNSNNAILDDIWAWRADHGNGVGWTTNTANTGVIVNGDNVTAYGLFVEHFQKYEVIWNGNGGTDIFFQNEMPYDVPSQAAWMEARGVDGYAAFKVSKDVTSFTGYGMGSYSFFNQGLTIFAAHAFEVPVTLPAGSLHDLLTVFLDSKHGMGGILNVVNDTGGPSIITNVSKPITVVSYP